MDELRGDFSAARPAEAAEAAVLRSLADSSCNVLFVLDKQKRVLELNRRACETFIVDHGFRGSLVELTGSAELDTMVSEALRNEERELEEQLQLNGRWWHVHIHLVDRTGPQALVNVALEDVTQLVRLNRARRDMVANISHELRTPIANIRLIIDSLFMDTAKPGRKNSIRSLHAIGRETDALQWMSEELLDLSMIESGQALMKMVDVQTSDVVAGAVERMADFCEDRDVRIVQKVPRNLYVLCDPDKLVRVLVNLLHNALKWSPRGEKIRVVVTREDDEILFGVIDRGEGVPKEFAGRIFERFYQVDPSRSGNEGAGLGLAICRHIIEAHGGTIRAESNAIRKGGRFYFTVPAGNRP
ncbi:MAG: HAMP domain-containing sensor histidine kinase [Anaerolineaceae bacterium]|nr:HAMP domain-containing sensor histidine kinase [Anaerolineaceae bacterium]